MADLVERTQKRGIGKKATHSRLQTLVADGEVAQFPGVGRGTEYTTHAADPSLGWIFRKAEAEVIHGTGKAGRRAKGSRRVETITDSHLKRARRALRHIGRFWAPRGGQPTHAPSESEIWDALDRVRGEYLHWDPHHNDWQRALELYREAVAAAEKQPQGDQESGLRIVLDWAATHSLLTRGTHHEPGYTPVSPSWQPTYTTWTEALQSELGFRNGRSVLLLMEGVSACGYQSPEEADWGAVTDHLSNRCSADKSISRHRRSEVRRAYRTLCNLGLIDGPPWYGNARNGLGDPLSLISAGSAREIASTYAWDGERPAGWCWESWPWPNCERVSELVDGEYGLRVALRAMTVVGAARSTGKVPDRGRFPREPVRAKTSRSAVAWSRRTAETNLTYIGMVAGWIAKHREVDWTAPGNDLRELLRREHWEALIEWFENHSSHHFLARLAALHARLASPILESMAIRQGDEDLADEARDISKWLSSPDGLSEGGMTAPSVREAAAEEASRQRGGAIEVARAASRANEEAWTASSSLPWALDQKQRISRAAVEKLVSTWGSLDEQLQGVLAHSPPGGRKWAVQVQRTLWWMEQLMIPLRPSTLRLANAGHRRITSEEVLAAYPREAMKSKRVFEPRYSQRATSPEHHKLAQIYLAPHGALATILGRSPADDDPLWPSTRGARYRSERPFSEWMAKMVRRFESSLDGGVTFASLEEAGVLNAKLCRHSVAKPLVYAGKAPIAASILHHSTTRMVEQVYGALTEADFLASDAIRTATSSEPST